MAIQIIDKGSRNQVVIHPWMEANGTGRIEFMGDDNHIEIGGPAFSCNNLLIRLGHRNRIEISPLCTLNGVFIHAEQNSTLRIGVRTGFTSGARLIMGEPSSIEIGANCMIAGQVQILTSDMHTIYDVETHQRINVPADVEVGEHVWLGLEVILLKGAKIGKNSVVGMRSTVVGTIPSNSLAVGSPARVVRSGVNWDPKRWPLPSKDLTPTSVV